MKNNRFFTLAVGTIGLLTLIILIGWYVLKPQPNIIQGEIEATQVKVASKLAGRIDTLYVHEGDEVSIGQMLYTITSPEVHAKYEQANAVKDAAMAQRLKANNGARAEEIQAAYTTWQKAEAAADFAEKSYRRIQNLFDKGVVPAQKRDEVETQYKAAKYTAESAKAVYDMAKKGARNEDKMAAGALVNQASGVVSEVSSYLNETHLKSPINGEVASVIAERGELIGTGYPVITLVDLSDVWVSFNLREDLLAKIKKGKTFTGTIPALGNKEVEFTVTYIAVQGAYATWTATKTSGDFDRKTFEIKAKPTAKNIGLRPGMSVLVDWNKIKD
jgi:HlyD family secretion protein